MQRDWDVIVIGLGALGSGAAYWASTRPGARVLGLERFEFGHANGASADHSRIIRLSYHRPDYVRLAKRAYASWAVVEEESSDRIVTVTGGLDLWPADPAIPKIDYTASLDAEGVPYELLDAPEVMRRWPQWRLTDDVTAMWQAQGGLADPNKGNAAHRRLATARGATLLDRTPVTSIREVGGELEVTAGDTVHRAGKVILTADAWTNELLAPFGRRLPLTVTKEQVTYFAAPDPAAFAPDRFPVWIWMDEPSFYGFPTYGEAGPKAAQDCGGQPTTPATRTFDRDEAAYARVRTFMETHLPGRRRTRHLYEDLSVHADAGSGVRRGSTARGARRDRAARGGPRVQVRLGAGADRRRTESGRGDRVRWRAGRVPSRPPDPARVEPADELDGLTRQGPWRVPWACPCTARRAVPPYGHSGGRAPQEEIRLMRSSLRARAARVVGAGVLAATVLLPAAAPTAAADPVILRVGTIQDNDSLNPYETALVVGYEAYQLTYNLLVDFGPDLEPIPGFANSWEHNADGSGWTFHIRDGMKWSDGTPATSEDACFSWQLGLDAIKDGGSLGLGYLEPALTDAGVTAVDCSDPTKMVVTTKDASERVLQTYMPIIPKHIYGKETYKTIAKAKFDAPLVGTGPYQAVEWQTGQFIRFERNPNYWGTQAYPDEVIIQIFKTADTMLQALKAGEIDYAHNVNPDQLKSLATAPDIQTVVGASNGWTQLAFNTYGTGTGDTIEGGGPSTKALLDPKFRDALGYAVDHKMLVDKVLGGFGDVGNTNVPPVLTQWHVEPTTPRTFDIELAKQKLLDAGYPLDASGNRLDKEGKPISLRLVLPNTDKNYASSASFVVDWYKELGIKVSTQSLDQGTLTNLVLPPSGDPPGKAKYDIELWGWSGSVDPNALLQIFKCDAIGSSSDSQYCNPEYDKLYDAQLAATTTEERHAIIAQMQNLIYDEAPYDILYYDSNLDAYRTDRFAGWQKQPTANGTPFFTYGTLDYTKLTDASAVPTPAPSVAAPSAGASTAVGASAAPAASAAATPAPSAGSGTGSSTSSDSSPLLLGGLVVVVVVVAGIVLARRRSSGSKPDDDEDD